jgi:hypothetical protein
MRTPILIVALAVLTVAVFPTHADELILTLNSYTGSGMPTSLNPDPDTCLAPNCVLFTGTLTDTDVDLQPDLNPTFLSIGFPYTAAADGIDFAGLLSLDNIAPDSLVLSGDTNADDLNPPTSESGPVFGIDIPVGTPLGVYEDTVFLDITPSNGNPVFTVSADVTVDVAPEPATPVLLFGALVVLASRCGVNRKWPSVQTSR